jgi:S1-C subfamily serine protease
MTTRFGDARATRVVIWIVSALCAGVWLGIAARIAMRFIALEAGVSPGFSSGGSLEVILFGAMIGMPVAAGVDLPGKVAASILVWNNRRSRPICDPVGFSADGCAERASRDA